jgi:hypothetical protein
MSPLVVSGTVDFTDWSWGDETRKRVAPSLVAEVVADEITSNSMMYADMDDAEPNVRAYLPLSEDGITLSIPLWEVLDELVSDYVGDVGNWGDGAKEDLEKLDALASMLTEALNKIANCRSEIAKGVEA